MLNIQNLSTGYPGKPVLQNIHASFPAGQITAVLGPNGCGKTTLLKALCGVLPAKGQVYLEDVDLMTLPAKQRAKQVAYLSQSRPVPDLTVGDLVLCGRYPYTAYPRQYTPEDEAAAQDAMARMGMEELARCPISQLSGGQRQKAYIAMALAQDARVILLDEPTTFLDVAHQLQLLALLRQLAREGKTVVAVLHDLQSAMQTADHILLLDKGCVAAQGTPETVFASGQLDRVFGVEVCRTSTEDRWQYYCKPFCN